MHRSSLAECKYYMSDAIVLSIQLTFLESRTLLERYSVIPAPPFPSTSGTEMLSVPHALRMFNPRFRTVLIILFHIIFAEVEA